MQRSRNALMPVWMRYGPVAISGLDVKPENMQAINDAIKEFGRVSTPAVGRL